ncbi:tetratricopeptide repeat protein [Euryhalocaulis caribicus]|uniref:tetratricopeptide repeat protein n=1 Tax=Euryhalocaulis caribicus TaxID=1161401 RepID=UPI0003A1EC72|nr:tetratricopeptide repeat protein [Euryhalocaulis caribicus]
MARASSLKLILAAAAASLCLSGPALTQAGSPTPEEALARLNGQIQNSPENPELLVSRGRLHFLLGNYDQAAADLWNATEANPALRGNATLQIMRGRAVMEAGRPGDAVKVFDLVQGRTALRARAAYWQAEAYRRAGNDDSAIAALETALELDPDYSLARIRLAELTAPEESLEVEAEAESDPFGLRGDSDSMQAETDELASETAADDGPVALQPDDVEEAVEAETEEAGSEPLDAPDTEVADVTEPGDEAEQAEPEAREGPRFVLETGDEDEEPVEPEPEDEAEPEPEPEAESESETGAEALEADAEAELAGDDAPEEEAGADIGIAIGDDADGAAAEAEADADDAAEAEAVADALGSATPEGPSADELRARAEQANADGDLVTELDFIRGLYLSQNATPGEIERYAALTALLSTKDAVRDFQIARLAESARHVRLAAALYESVEKSGALQGRNLAVARGNLATQQLHMGNLNAGLAAAERAIEADPDYANGWAVKGLILDEMGKPGEAVSAMKTAYDNGARAPELLARLEEAGMVAAE